MVMVLKISLDRTRQLEDVMGFDEIPVICMARRGVVLYLA